MNDDQNTSASQGKESGSAIGSMASDIKSAATNRYDEAVTEVRARADGTKTDVANEVNDVAKALRHASEELRSGSAQERTLGQIANGIADASDSIRDKDLGEIANMVSRLARENPVLFLGGAALLGFAASRYVKASGEQDTTPDADVSAERTARVDTFVSEGNPNTQPMGAAP